MKAILNCNAITEIIECSYCIYIYIYIYIYRNSYLMVIITSDLSITLIMLMTYSQLKCA